MLESNSSVIPPLIAASFGLGFLYLSLIASSAFIPAICGFVCFLVCVELLLRPRVLVSSGSRSIRILVWNWLRLRRVVKDEIPFAEVRELLVEAEFELGVDEHPVVWHLVVLCGKNHRADLAWHFQQAPTMLVAKQLVELTGKPIRDDITKSASQPAE
ncbi:MAG: hypothetical protein WB723_04420 [Candidatus Acidiferrales bacterium]